jgi:hypothetical protein
VTRLRLALLIAEHDLTGFDCGNDQLTSWLIRHALASQRADLARTYLALEDNTVVGYVSLTTGSVRHDEAPKRYTRGMPHYPIPTILIARLAVDERRTTRRRRRDRRPRRRLLPQPRLHRRPRESTAALPQDHRHPTVD